MLEKLSFLDEKFNWIIVSILHLLLVITMIAIIPALEELYWLLEMRGFCATISFRHFWKLRSVRVSLRCFQSRSSAQLPTKNSLLDRWRRKASGLCSAVHHNFHVELERNAALACSLTYSIQIRVPIIYWYSAWIF